MITLRIISASNLPAADINGLSDPYVRVYAKNFGRFSHTIGRTKTIKNSLNPNWDEYLKIPFVIFDSSIRLSFFDSDTLDDDILGEADIFPSLQNFYRNDTQVQHAKINLRSKYKSTESSSVQYSIIPTITDFDFKPKKNPKKVYVYLTFGSFQPNSQENIHLLAYGVNKNGTLVDPIYDTHTEGEIEATHFSPAGLVQVYTFTAEDFQESGLYDEQYFFVVKATNFIGKVTLTFVASPKQSNKKNYVDKFFIINNQYSINISKPDDTDQFLYAFPVVLKFSKGKCQIDPLQIPTTLQTMKISQNDTSKIDDMTIRIGQLICPKNKPLHRRYEITKFNRVSLDEAFQKCQLNRPPSKIDICIGWDTYTDVDLIIFQLLKNGKLLDPICSKKKKTDPSRSIKSGGDSTRGNSRGDDETTTIDLNKVSNDVKCIMICIASAKGIRFDCLSGTFIRFVDSESKKEVLFMNLNETEEIQPNCLLWGILRKVGDSWSVWPCYRFIEGCTPKNCQKSLVEFLNSGGLEAVFNS